MGGSALFFLFINIFIFTFIFWLLIFLTRFFLFKSSNISRGIFYECGFKVYETLDFKLTSNILIVAILLILYDIEFLLLISIFINISSYSTIFILFVIFIFLFISFLLYVDNLFLFLYWSN